VSIRTPSRTDGETSSAGRRGRSRAWRRRGQVERILKDFAHCTNKRTRTENPDPGGRPTPVPHVMKQLSPATVASVHARRPPVAITLVFFFLAASIRSGCRSTEPRRSGQLIWPGCDFEALSANPRYLRSASPPSSLFLVTFAGWAWPSCSPPRHAKIRGLGVYAALLLPTASRRPSRYHLAVHLSTSYGILPSTSFVTDYQFNWFSGGRTAPHHGGGHLKAVRLQLASIWLGPATESVSRRQRGWRRPDPALLHHTFPPSPRYVLLFTLT